jgi:hypothetical protein
VDHPHGTGDHRGDAALGGVRHVLEVYDGRGRFVDANDDFDGTDSRLVLDLEPGRYEFLVKGYWDEAFGAYALAFDFYERPPLVEVDVVAPGPSMASSPPTRSTPTS